MRMLHRPLLVATLLMAGACAPAPQPGPSGAEHRAATAADPQAAASPRAEAGPGGVDRAGNAGAGEGQMIVYKSPTCGCCLAWADQMRAAGFNVEVRDVDDLAPIKRQFGVPASSASCHTARVGDYFIEGHVPAADIRRLLSEQPQAKGLAVPGMPLGSPGMEVPDGRTQPYDVLLIGADGSSEVFASHGGPGD